MNSVTKKITRGAMIAAAYFAVSMLMPALTYGTVQFRLAEALTMMPFLMVEGVYGVVIGCLLTNIFSTFGLYDAIFGTLTTLLAAVLTRLIKNKWLAALPPIILNATVLPLMWYFLGSEQMYIINVLSVLASQTVIIYGLGVPLVTLLKRRMPYLN